MPLSPAPLPCTDFPPPRLRRAARALRAPGSADSGLDLHAPFLSCDLPVRGGDGGHVLSGDGHDIYFIKVESPRFGPYWAEMAEDSNSHDVVLADLCDGQHEDAVEIICVRADGSWHVVSSDFAQTWLDALFDNDEFDPHDVPALIERHIDWSVQYEEHIQTQRAEPFAATARIPFARRS